MGEIKAATRESLGNLKKVLELSGSSLDKVVKFNSELSPVVDRATWDIPLILSLFERHGGDGHHERGFRCRELFLPSCSFVR
jgi:enamine deaminase RidA (YjgF/YER057c/UK114 family)